MIEGSMAAVYDALTTEAGLRGWWTLNCEVGKRVGAESVFRFGKTYKRMQIEVLEPGREVRWRCVGHHHHAPGELSRTDEWVDTMLAFQLTTQTPGRTLLDFEHAGLHPKLECYVMCERGWEYYLKNSLKTYVETGRGEPFCLI